MEEKEVKKEKEIYEKWWFWCIIVFIILIILVSEIFESNEIQQISENNQINDNTTTSENKIETNPYISTQDCNGTYSFSLSSDNGSGYMYYAIGAISFNGGECKIKYNRLSEAFKYEDIIELEGFCGINEQDNSIFYFILKNENDEEFCTYKCTKTEKNLDCELKSEYDLAGCTNNKLDLTYVNDSQDIDTVYNNIVNQEKAKKEAEEKEKKAKEEAEEKAKKEKEETDFKASCQAYTFEQMARNPDNFKGTNVKLTGEVIQALYGSYSVDLRVNITKKGTYSTYYTDTVYITYTPEEGENKILEDDIITIYGTSGGDYSYTSTMGAPVTLPLIYGKYIEINSK